MKKKLITEAVRYGNREKNSVLNSLSDYKFGIEIELHRPDGVDIESTQELLTELLPINFYPDNDIDFVDTLLKCGAEEDDFFLRRFVYGSLYKTKFKKLCLFPEFKDIILQINESIDDSSLSEYMDETYYDCLQKLKQFVESHDTTISEEETASDDFSVGKGLTEYATLYLMPSNESFIEEYQETLYSVLEKYNHLLFDAKNAPEKEFDELDENEKNTIADVFTSRNFDALVEVVSTPNMDSIYNQPDIHEKLDTITLDRLYDFVDIEISDIDSNSLEDFFRVFGIDSSMYLYNYIVEHYGPEMQDELDNINANLEVEIKHVAGNVLRMVYRKPLKFTYTETDEHDGQLEIIQSPVTGNSIVDAYNEAFDIIEVLLDNDYRTVKNSGLHMSISYKNGSQKIDFTKFMLLSNIYNVLKGDKEMTREYVVDIFRYIETLAFGNTFITKLLTSDATKLEKVISDELLYNLDAKFSGTIPDGIKFKSVNIEHYFSQYGRVELRFFGGYDYNTKKDEYFDILIRCMYALKLACEPNEKRKEYLGTLYRFANKRFENRYDVSIPRFKLNYDYVQTRMKSIKNTGDLLLLQQPTDNFLNSHKDVNQKWEEFITKFEPTTNMMGTNEFVNYFNAALRYIGH